MIGSGSSGVVKKVRHKLTGNVYVLKVINFDIGSEQVSQSGVMQLATAQQAT